jgi:hypothetical protein
VVQQTSLANVITSCRRLAQIQWQELFEAVSRLDIELANDPVAIYSRVDFETRNRYRDAVEQIARWSKRSEMQIAGDALALAGAAADEVTKHVGYYLVDEGRKELERVVDARFHGVNARAGGFDGMPPDSILEASHCFPLS